MKGSGRGLRKSKTKSCGYHSRTKKNLIDRDRQFLNNQDRHPEKRKRLENAQDLERGGRTRLTQNFKKLSRRRRKIYQQQ